MKKVYIKNKIIKNILSGHPWCFSGAVEKFDKSICNGELCEIYSNNIFLGIGYFNNNSDIRIRIITRIKQNIDSNFFFNRFKNLKNEKEKYIRNTNAYRLVFGESDNLPGLVVDIYNNVIIIQIHTLGMDKLKDYIVEALVKLFNPQMIFEKSETVIRNKEGLDNGYKKLLYGKEIKYVDIIENNFKFKVNVIEGQKTGFFLDQRENRKAILKYCENKKVLNCFAYTGGFSVYAASIASTVTSVDISKNAIEDAKINFKLNGYDAAKYKFISADVFEFLKSVKYNDYDVIILDPPSFAKNKKQIKNAIKAYITINSKALEKLAAHGILITSSCTSHIDEQIFIKILQQCAVNIKCQLKLLESNMQPFDHPYNLSFPEGRYLKFFVLLKIPVL